MPRDRTSDMLDAARRAFEFLEGIDRTGFDQDIRTQFAVVRALEILGEAATHVEEDVKAAHPQIPWKEMVGLRNVVIHQYGEVDLGIVWNVVKKDLPPLIEQLEPIVPSEDDE